MIPLQSPEPLESQAFNYNKLNSETYIVVQQRTFEIKALMRRTAQDIIEIGLKLTEVKEELGHGNFIKWLKAEFGWSGATATRFMQVGNQFKFVKLTNLEIAASALYLLARPSTPKEARQEVLERAFQGEAITYSAAKEIVVLHTIDVKAETIEEKVPAPAEVSLGPELPNQLEPLDEPPQEEVLAESNENPAPERAPMPEQAEKYLPEKEATAPSGLAPENYAQINDPGSLHVLNIYQQDSWAGKAGRIWQIISDEQLRVDVEGHPGVKSTLKPERLQCMPKVFPDQQAEQVLDENWADEPDFETPAISDCPPIAQRKGEATPHFQAGDRVFFSEPNQQGQKWIGEVAEVIEAAEDCIKLIVELRPSGQTAVTTL